jgi:hypothetical protein
MYTIFTRSRFIGVMSLLLVGLTTGPAAAQDKQLAEYFGFDGLETIAVDRGAGPVMPADLNGDGYNDLIIVNNFKSRIELHYQKPGASPDEEVTRTVGVNEFPEHWRYRRENFSVSHQIAAILAHDFDNDGLMDLIYAGTPPEIVFVRQKTPGTFEVTRRHRVRNLGANRNAFAVANVIGNDKPELITIADGKMEFYTLNRDLLGEPTVISAGESMIAFLLEDFNGDELLDVVGIIPEDSAPIRLWLSGMDGSRRVLGAQFRFEMAALREAEPVRLSDVPAAQLATIERASKRLALYKLDVEQIEGTGDRDASIRTYSFTDAGKRRERQTTVADVDGDGLVDLIATDVDANSVVVYRQLEGKGLLPGEPYPSLADLSRLVAGNVDDDPQAEVFVLSEKESIVGRSDVGTDGLPFPTPIAIPGGTTPVTLNLAELDGKPWLAVVVKDSRDYSLELIGMNGERETVKLGTLSRSPDTVLALDADQDGKTDLLLFTRDKPMTMVRATDEGYKLFESKDMGQFGFVQAATAENTAVFDVDGDDKNELLIADRNFVRALRYSDEPGEGASPGWQVVEQINASDSTTKLVSVAILRDRIVAADRENSRLVMMGRDEDGAGWAEQETINVRGFSFSTIYAGSFSGDDQENILAIGEHGFAVVRLAGERYSLTLVDSWRTDKQQRFQHELSTGDLNNDGFIDMVSLDAGEQMCEVFTFTETGKMLYAVGFKVFESKIFSGGEPREFQPSAVWIADVTGDDAQDMILLSHDRVLIYPQMTQDSAQTSASQ